MAIKTVSLEIDAYAVLVRARLHPRESFSSVVRRARWEQAQYTGAALSAYLGERSRRYLALSDPSLQALAQVTGRKTAPSIIRVPEAGFADAYVVDLSFLLELEMEVATQTEGPAKQFVAGKPESVFRLSVITHGEFLGCLAADDGALGGQILGRFELANLSPAIAGFYAASGSNQTAGTDRTQCLDNDLWVGCTAVTQNAPLLTRRSERYVGIEGLQTVTL